MLFIKKYCFISIPKTIMVPQNQTLFETVFNESDMIRTTNMEDSKICLVTRRKILRGTQREICLRKEGRPAHHAAGLTISRSSVGSGPSSIEEAYLTEWHNIKKARAAISSYIHNYNFERCHSAIGNVTLASVYCPAMLYEADRDAA